LFWSNNSRFKHDAVYIVGFNNERTGFSRIGNNYEFPSNPGQKFDACGPTLALQPKLFQSGPPFTRQTLRGFGMAGLKPPHPQPRIRQLEETSELAIAAHSNGYFTRAQQATLERAPKLFVTLLSSSAPSF